MVSSRRWLSRWQSSTRAIRAQTGLTLVETMVAAALLLVGLLGTVKLIDVASSSQGDAKAREGATNLAREVLEDAHDTAYTQVGSSGWITPSLQNLSNDTNSTNTVTTPNSHSAQTSLTRRKISYTANVSWCSVDDSKDSYGTHSSSINWCSDSTTTGTGDSAPEDLKRVTATITYSINGNAKTLSQTVTFSATGGMVAPSVQSLCASGLPIGAGTSCTGPFTISVSSPTTQNFIGTAPGAADMKFAVNGVEATSGVTNNNDGTWTYAWPLTGLNDGNYTVTATAVDALGNRSQPLSQQVKLARGSTLAPQNIQAGYNYVNPTGPWNGGTEVAELQWDASPDGSVTGYEVLRGATSVCGGQTSLANTCIDTSPPTTGGTVTTYTIKTWYQDASGNAQSISTTYNLTAPYPPLATTYYMINSQTNPTTKCDTGFGAWRDLLSTYPGSFSDSTSTASAFLTCSPAVPSGSTLAAGTVTADFWVTNSNNKSCTTSWWISHNATPSTGGTVIGTTVSYTAPSSSTTHITSNQTLASGTSLSASDQINLFIDVRSASGNCSQMTLDYGSFFHPSSLAMPSLTSGGAALSVPNTPTGLTVTANADGTRTLTWNAPSSDSSHPAPDFYRIYRDGTATSARIDTADAVNTSVTTASTAGATTLTVASTTGYSAGETVLVDTGTNQDFMTISSISGNTITFTAGMTHAHAVNVPVVLRAVSWTDTTASSSHSYRITAVSPAMGESPLAGPVTG